MTLELRDGRYCVPKDDLRGLVARAIAEARDMNEQLGSGKPVTSLDVMGRLHACGLGVTEAEVREVWPAE